MDLQSLRERVIDEVARLLAETAAPAPVATPVATGLAPAPPAAQGAAELAPAGPAAVSGPAPAAVPGMAAPGPAVPPRAPGAGLERLQAACLVNPHAAVPARVDVLVVLTGRDTVGDGLAGVRELLDQGCTAALVTSPELLESTGPGLMYEVLRGGPAFCHGDEDLARRLAGAAGVVLVPALSVPAAARVSQLLAGDLASAVLVHAILQGKPVVAARDAVALPAAPAWGGNPAVAGGPAAGGRTDAAPGRPGYALPGAGGKVVPFALRRKLEEYTTTLRGYGVALVEAARLSAEAAARLDTAPARTPAALATPGAIPAAPATPGAAPAAPATPATAPAAPATPAAVPAASAAVVPAAGAPAAAPAAPAGWDRELARIIDHTLLKPDATAAQIEQLCREARQYGFASVCVNPGWVPLCARALAGSGVKVCTVIGFPLGATSSTAKALEARDACARGATEVDMVLNVGALKSGQDDTVAADIRAVVQAAKPQALVKVILETGLLTDQEKVKACELARAAGADFVKTSTGFGAGGATVADVALMRRTVGPEMGVKASGGIRDRETALAMVRAGATRLGTSSGVAIVAGASAARPEKY